MKKILIILLSFFVFHFGTVDAQTELLTNGDFETRSAAPWVLDNGTGTSGCDQPWVVSTGPFFPCNGSGDPPIDGVNAINTAFDGDDVTVLQFTNGSNACTIFITMWQVK